MAEGLMRAMTASSDVEVVSAGTGAVPGMPATREAVQAMAEEGIDISAHSSRALDGFMLEEADRVYVMTEGHRRMITGWFKGMKDKVSLVREYDPEKDDPEYPNIPDPLGSSVEVYRRVRDILKRSITEIVKKL